MIVELSLLFIVLTKLQNPRKWKLSLSVPRQRLSELGRAGGHIHQGAVSGFLRLPRNLSRAAQNCELREIWEDFALSRLFKGIEDLISRKEELGPGTL